MATKKSGNNSSEKVRRTASADKRTASVQRNKKAKGSNKPKKDWYLIYILVTFALAVLLSIFVYVDTGSGGVINSFVKNLVFGLFGWTGYLVPVSFIGYFLYLMFNRKPKRMWLKVIQTTLALSDLSALIGLSAIYSHPIDAFYDGYTNYRGGGYIGALLSGFSEHLFQVIISYIVFSVLLVLLIAYIVHLPLKEYIKLAVEYVTGNTTEVKPKRRRTVKSQPRRKQDLDEDDVYKDNKGLYDDAEKPSIKRQDNINYGYDDDDEGSFLAEFFGIKHKSKNKEIEQEEDEIFDEYRSEKKQAPKRKREITEGDFFETEPPKKTQHRKTSQADDDFSEADFSDGIDEIFGKDIPETDDVSFVDKTTSSKTYTSGPDNDAVNDVVNKAVNNEDSIPSAEGQKKSTKRESKDREKKISDSEKQSFSDELDSAMDRTPVKYVFPSMELLNKAHGASSDIRAEMRRTAENLITVLSDFGVKARLLQVTQGPAVTRYEIQPDTGTKLSKITGLAEDIALNLAVATVLVAPVPGKAAVGIEIPNKKVSSVTIREILESDEFKNARSSLTVGLGKDIGGNVVVGNIAKWPHILIAGQTGSGKSVCINTIITSILYKASPEDVKLIMIDPKVVELSGYNGIPHLLIPVVSDPKKAAGALNWAVTEMMRRYDLFKNTGVRKLEGYNKLMEQQGMEKIPQIVIIIDELADLMMVAAKEVEDYICRLAQLARAAGIYLIIATQRPSVDVITGLIKANVPSRIAFSTASQTDSRTILDKGGAEKLLGMGDMLYYPTGARTAARVQGAYVSDDEIERITGFIKESIGETHYSEELEEEIQNCATSDNSASSDAAEDGDSLLEEAINLAVDLGKISTSMVQRRLGVGYARAGRIIDQMEARGIISGANGSKPRDVLISHADFAGANNSMAEDYDEEE